MRYTLDWQAIDIDGANTLTSGGQQIGVTVATPEPPGNARTQWALGAREDDAGMLRSGEVRKPTVLELSFDRAVTDLSFEVHDLDSGPGSLPWEDRVTVVTRDAGGGETRIALSELTAARGGAGGTEGTSLDTPAPPDSVPVHIAGPVTGLKLVHDAGDDAEVSGTVGVSELHFEAAPASDGIVHGTDGDDVIVEDGYVDDDGDEIDNGDAILFDDAPDDDRVFAKAGDDVVDADDGDDTVEGGAGSDDIAGGEGNDSLWGGDRGGSPGDIPDEGGPGGHPPDPDPEDDRDTLSGGAGDDSMVGGDDDDVLLGGSGDDTLEGGIDDDSLGGGAGHDSVIGGQGDDTLGGGADDDVVRGGAGDDVITGGQGNDLLEGGDDADTFVLTSAENDSGDTISGGSGGRDIDRLDISALGAFGVDWTVENLAPDGDPEPFDGFDGHLVFLDGQGNETGRTSFTNIEIVCFTPGTRIATPAGQRPVEELAPGDRVLTRDNGVQEIAWAGRTGLNAADFAARPHLAPVLIRAGALGGGLPERDMLVSPQHRVLMRSDRAALYFDEREVLVAAKHLVNGTSIVQRPVPQTTYIHFMCAAHEIVLSDGAWTESFQPGDWSLRGIDAGQRAEILELFPELATERGRKDYRAARRTLKRHEAVLLAG